MFQGLTVEIMADAVRMVEPSITAFFEDPRHGTSPTLYVGVHYKDLHYEVAIGDPDRSHWGNPDIDRIENAKGLQGQRTGKRGRKIMTDFPWLIEPGDTRYVGGYSKAGLDVAASAFPNQFDEGFSRMIWSAIQAICRFEVGKFTDDDPVFFLSKDEYFALEDRHEALRGSSSRQLVEEFNRLFHQLEKLREARPDWYDAYCEYHPHA